MKIENWGLVPYSEAWKRQTELFNAMVEAKQVGKTYENRIIFVEHPHVYTLGKSGKETNMLLGEAQLKMIGATLYQTQLEKIFSHIQEVAPQLIVIDSIQIGRAHV